MLPRPAVGGSSITARRSPTNQLSAQSSSTVKTLPVTQTRSLGSHELVATQAARSNEVPMKSFVHELCRRSRTSGMVLQTALCYLEALRSKVPQLVRLEMEGKGVRGDPDLSSRITVMDDSFSAEATTLVGSESYICGGDEELIATIKVLDDCPLVETPSPSKLEDIDITPTNEKPNVFSTSSSLLPSPLLCPRRAFVASLILATKFTQDRCYSNRAWGKLCGLPPREIGRCERALGDALEWRLWVGKKQPVRTFGRSQSEGTVLSPASDAAVYLAPAPSLPLPAGNVAQIAAGLAIQKPCSPNPPKPSATGLRRSTTAPSLSPSSFSPMFVQPIGQPVQQPIASTSTAQFQQLFYEPEDISPVPSLSHSPSSTESSDGDQTIQMSTFYDENTISNISGALPKAPFDMDSWSWTAQAALSLPSAHPNPPASIPHAPHNLFLPKAMMDDAAAPSGIIPEPMVGVLQDGYEGTGGAYCGQEEAFVTYGGGGGMTWDHSLVY